MKHWWQLLALIVPAGSLASTATTPAQNYLNILNGNSKAAETALAGLCPAPCRDLEKALEALKKVDAAAEQKAWEALTGKASAADFEFDALEKKLNTAESLAGSAELTPAALEAYASAMSLALAYVGKQGMDECKGLLNPENCVRNSDSPDKNEEARFIRAMRGAYRAVMNHHYQDVILERVFNQALDPVVSTTSDEDWALILTDIKDTDEDFKKVADALEKAETFAEAQKILETFKVSDGTDKPGMLKAFERLMKVETLKTDLPVGFLARLMHREASLCRSNPKLTRRIFLRLVTISQGLSTGKERFWVDYEHSNLHFYRNEFNKAQVLYLFPNAERAAKRVLELKEKAEASRPE